MWIVAIGWMYVVTLMAATEPSVIAGIMTFLFYGILPLSLVFYLTGAWQRGRVRRARKRKSQHSKRGDAPTN
ncbi:hypothetical protein ACI48D_24905 [Massilia sp. LXY-6]|uniref:hypothetical protein n=1 Tax=Massilia sp. LXY-6 TaxID=3379823 RepID=UPI003EE152ED